MKIKKAFFALVNLISVLVIALAVVVLIIVLLTKPGEAPNIAGYSALRITTGSMEPTYGVDTMILVKKTDPSEIKEGDVISFYSSDPALDGAVNTHRVVSIQQEDDHYIYETKGDGNNVIDAYPADSRYLVGKVVGSSTLIGKLSRLAANPLIFIPIILVPLALILIWNVVSTVSLAGKIAKEEEEEAVREAIREIREKKGNKNDYKSE